MKSLGISSFPSCVRLCKIGRIFRENGNRDLEFLSVQSDCGYISDVDEVSVSKQERRTNRMCNIGNTMDDSEDMFARYLTRAINMFSGREMAGRAEMLKVLREIGKSNVNEECLMEMNEILGELSDRIAISGEIKDAKLTQCRKKSRRERRT